MFFAEAHYANVATNIAAFAYDERNAVAGWDVISQLEGDIYLRSRAAKAYIDALPVLHRGFIVHLRNERSPIGIATLLSRWEEIPDDLLTLLVQRKHKMIRKEVTNKKLTHYLSEKNARLYAESRSGEERLSVALNPKSSDTLVRLAISWRTTAGTKCSPYSLDGNDKAVIKELRRRFELADTVDILLKALPERWAPSLLKIFKGDVETFQQILQFWLEQADYLHESGSLKNAPDIFFLAEFAKYSKLSGFKEMSDIFEELDALIVQPTRFRRDRAKLFAKHVTPEILATLRGLANIGPDCEIVSKALPDQRVLILEGSVTTIAESIVDMQISSKEMLELYARDRTLIDDFKIYELDNKICTLYPRTAILKNYVTMREQFSTPGFFPIRWIEFLRIEDSIKLYSVKQVFELAPRKEFKKWAISKDVSLQELLVLADQNTMKLNEIMVILAE